VLVYDVETLRTPEEVCPEDPVKGWQNPVAMGFGSAVVYDYRTDRYYCFMTAERQQLIEMLFGRFVVSFNGIKFDNRVALEGRCEETQELSTPWLNYDLLLEVVRAKFQVASVREAELQYGAMNVHDGTIGLDGLAHGTLGMRETGHGSKSPLLIREGKWGELFAYNLHDVRLTRKLLDFLMRYGYLIDRGGFKIEIEVPEWVRKEYLGTQCGCGRGNAEVHCGGLSTARAGLVQSVREIQSPGVPEKFTFADSPSESGNPDCGFAEDLQP